MYNYKFLRTPNIELYSTRKITEMLWLVDNEISYFDKIRKGKILTLSEKFEREDMVKYSTNLFNELNRRH